MSLGAASAAISVACGAFGAHALKARVAAGLLAPQRLEVWHTAAQYQMWHALALMLVAIAMRTGMVGRGRAIPVGLLAGTVLFSGSLYALVLTDVAAFGAITPLGGATWIACWIAIAVCAARRPDGAS
ncbi:MAG: hypothetical protein JWM80_3000 [Cyanobacteria bacterium RYN_339]|nr:hypothetical protein [Cyanobacteria bacterium RYN_339]